MVSGRAFIFHIYIPWGKTLSLVPKSKPSVKVKYKSHIFFLNMAILPDDPYFELLYGRNLLKT